MGAGGDPPAAGRDWPLLAAFAAAEERLGRGMERRGRSAALAYEVLRFGVKQAWACLFGGALLALIAASRLWYPGGAALSRYDALALACLALQALLLAAGLETLAEAGVILVFHAVGTAMELFKTSVGSWSYPEASRLRIGGVPLFTGFRYAAVGATSPGPGASSTCASPTTPGCRCWRCSASPSTPTSSPTTGASICAGR